MFQWLRQHIELFLANYADIGDSHESATKVQYQHEQFTRAALVRTQNKIEGLKQ